MVAASEQLDRRFAQRMRLADAFVRPPRGWIRAIRDALGMTTAQLAARMGVKQPRISELERAEVGGNITMLSLERAAEAMGCRLVYALVPLTPLTTMIDDRAARLANEQLASIEQTMRLEDQAVRDRRYREEARQRLVTEFKRRPSRLWDTP